MISAISTGCGSKSCAIGQAAHMATTVTLEAHPTRIDREAWCPACHTWSATECDISLVARDSLHVIARLRGVSCPCGFEDHQRLT